jgi:hypothetical protein
MGVVHILPPSLAWLWRLAPGLHALVDRARVSGPRGVAEFRPDQLRPARCPLLGQQIITCCPDGGKLEDYEQFIPAG